MRLSILALRIFGLALIVLLLSPAGVFADGLTLKGLRGGELRGGDLKGDIILVVWASWSPRCRDIVDQINALEKKWGSKAKIVSVVFQEDAKDVNTFLAKGPRLGSPIYLDSSGDFSKKHHVTALPGLLIYNDGKQTFRGKLPNDPDSLVSRSLGDS